MERLVPFLIESENGHDTEPVPESEVPQKVGEQLDMGKWATVEKKDGSTEVITEKPNTEGTPQEQPKEEGKPEEPKPEEKQEEPKPEQPKEEGKPEEKKDDGWGDTFKEVKSVTSTSKMKGG